MKSRDSLIRLKRFQVEERRRRMAQIEAMIAEFARMGADLDREIALEEQRAGISDMSHFAYPTYARAARARRDNLLRSSGELREQLEAAKALFDEAAADLAKATSLEGREKATERGHEALDHGAPPVVNFDLRVARA
jgi:flagellar protein FliJ